ncbi:MAG: hypothetical protein ABIJ56_22600 [Pseudomonadota bacterium]
MNNTALLIPLVSALLLLAASCGSQKAAGKSPEGGPCTVTDDCRDGLVCDEGVCTASGECPPGQVFCGGVCCAPGQVCSAGACVDECAGVVCGGMCCAGGEVCTADGCCAPAKVCGDGCCAGGALCHEGICIACPRPLCGGECCDETQICHNGICCPPGGICGDDCCEAGELCEFEQCRLDCGDLVRCGADEEACCTADELCYFDACILPGDECDDVYDCEPDEYCDLELGRCLPRSETTECEFYPPVGEFNPAEDWAWTGGDVMMTPAVGNLTDDNGDTLIDRSDIPDVVFTIFYGGDYHTNGTLIVVSGDSGSEHFRVDSPRIAPGAGVAIGDLDDDILFVNVQFAI